MLAFVRIWCRSGLKLSTEENRKISTPPIRLNATSLQLPQPFRQASLIVCRCLLILLGGWVGRRSHVMSAMVALKTKIIIR